MNKAAALKILSILKVFKSEEQRGRVLEFATNLTSTAALSNDELYAGRTITHLIVDGSFKDAADFDETIGVIQERLDFTWGVCDLCDRKGPIRPVTDVSGMDLSYCTLGCDKP